MPVIDFTPYLRTQIEAPRRQVPGATLREALEAVFAEQPRLRSYLVDDAGAVRKHIAIIVNGVAINDRATLSDPLEPDDEIFVMQALSGG